MHFTDCWGYKIGFRVKYCLWVIAQAALNCNLQLSVSVSLERMKSCLALDRWTEFSPHNVEKLLFHILLQLHWDISCLCDTDMLLDTEAHLLSSPHILTFFRYLDSQDHVCAPSKSLCGWACSGWTLHLVGGCASELCFSVRVEEGSLTQLTRPCAAAPFVQGLFKVAAGECQWC